MYSNKNESYYQGIRHDFLESLSSKKKRILEIGCGSGDTGCYALENGYCDEYYGIELHYEAGSAAKSKLTDVLIGDVEKMMLPWEDGFFEALLLSEVIEHLVDPWTLLKVLRPKLKNGAQVFASSPNVSHYSVIKMLLGGYWTLQDSGIMDRTHLRWFTPLSYSQLFANAGYKVISVGPVAQLGRKPRLASFLTMKKFDYLFWRQIQLIAEAH